MNYITPRRCVGVVKWLPLSFDKCKNFINYIKPDFRQTLIFVFAIVTNSCTVLYMCFVLLKSHF